MIVRPVISRQPIYRNFNACEVLARILLIQVDKLLLPMGWRAARQTPLKHRCAAYTGAARHTGREDDLRYQVMGLGLPSGLYRLCSEAAKDITAEATKLHGGPICNVMHMM
jgi:hypothetical protein